MLDNCNPNTVSSLNLSVKHELQAQKDYQDGIQCFQNIYGYGQAWVYL